MSFIFHFFKNLAEVKKSWFDEIHIQNSILNPLFTNLNFKLTNHHNKPSKDERPSLFQPKGQNSFPPQRTTTEGTL